MRKRTRSLGEEIASSVEVFVMLVLPLLLIAASIEVFITPIVLGDLMLFRSELSWLQQLSKNCIVSDPPIYRSVSV